MSDMRQLTEAGRRIEEASFAIIDAEAGPHGYSPAQWPVVRRIIHATADFEFARTLSFGPGAVEAGVAALRAGATVLADVQMIVAGLSRQRLATFGSEARCFIGDADVVSSAREGGGTRAAAAMRKAARSGLLDGALVAIGNAPTALGEVHRLVLQEGARPALVIGVPVGFVGAAEAKEAALALPVPYLVARGRKGGTPVAVAAVHALLAVASGAWP